MKPPKWFPLFSVMTLFLLTFFIMCTLPEDPISPQNTTMTPVFKDSKGVLYTYSFADTVGKTVLIGAALHLPQYIDSVAINTSANGVPLKSVVVTDIDSTYTNDTAWAEFIFGSPGVKNVQIIPYSSVASLAQFTGIITILNSTSPLANHAPVLNYTGATTIEPGKTCLLTMVTTDEDAGQNVSVSMAGAPDDATFIDGKFAWKAPDVAGAAYEITFTATDNGIPPLSDARKVLLKVSPVTANNAPKWDVATIDRAMNDTGTMSLSLSAICKDADAEQLTFILLDGTPEGDAINNDLYQFTATAAVVGKHGVKIVAKDAAGATDTLTINISVEANGIDGSLPTISLIYPVDTIVTSNSETFSIDAICSDASGIQSVKATYAGNDFSAVVTGEHSKITVTGLKSGVANKIVLSVKDNSAAHNETLKTITVTLIKSNTITFDKNDDAATGTMQIQSLNSGEAASLLPNMFINTGYTFTGWATTATGAAAFSDKASYIMGSSDVSLYAVWTPSGSSAITFEKNDAAATGTMAAQSITSGTSAALSINTFVNPGYNFAGWATTPSGSVEFTDNATYTMGTTAVTLYAVWSQNAPFKVTFDKNGAAATGTMGSQLVVSATAAPLSRNTFTNAGYLFSGWATTSTGAVAYTDGASYLMGGSDVTLYAIWTAIPTHNVIFDANGGSGTMANQPIMEGTSAALKTNTFTRNSYTFSGWATAAAGVVVHADGASYLMGGSDVTLYAIWTAIPTHNVIFDANGGSGTMANQPIMEGTSAALKTNTFTRNSYTFSGWATAAAGVVVHADGASYLMGASDVTLYAVWSAIPTHNVSFNANGGSGTMTAQSIMEGTSATLKANAFTRNSYTFSGWATAAAGVVVHADGASYLMGASDVTLYALWTAIPTHNVIFDANGGSGTMANQPIMEGTSAALKTNTFTRNSYTFSGWATTPGGAVTYTNGGTLPMGASDVTLYALWTAIPTHNVIFDANGGSGTMANQPIMEGTSAALKTNTFTRNSYTFSGWSTTPGGAVTYTNGGTLPMGASDVTIYAVWAAFWSKVTEISSNAIMSRFVLGPNEVLYYASAVSGDQEVSLYKLNTSGNIVLAASGEAAVTNGLALDLGSDGTTLFIGTGQAVASWAGLNWNFVDNGSWNSVGGYSMHIGSNNTPYVFAMGPTFNMRIWKLSSGTWDVVGTDISLPIGPGAGNNNQEYFCVKSGTVVYTVGSDESDPGVSVATLNGSLWNVQKLAETSKQENYQIIASGQAVYAAYTAIDGSNPVVYKGGSGSWAKLTSMAKSTSATGGFSIACSPSGVLYAGHVEGTNAVIKKYVGSSWQSATGSGDGVAFSTPSGANIQVLSGTNRCYAVIIAGTTYEVYQLPLN